MQRLYYLNHRHFFTLTDERLLH